jgi:hypothetical protein
MYETVEWQTDFSEVTMPALKRAPTISAVPLHNHPDHTYSKDTQQQGHSQEGLKEKTKDVLGEDQSGFI